MEKTFKVAGIGELLWDVLPSGKYLGGAPFNFAYHAGQLGCKPYVISAIGKDKPGEEILKKVNQLGIYSGYIQKNSYPTSTVTVKLDKSGHPDYTIHENVSWDYMHYNANLNSLSDELDAVCFGSLAQRNPKSALTIGTFLKALNPECFKVFDINLRQQYFNEVIITESIKLSNILKLNNDELLVLSKYYNLQGDAEVQLKSLIEKFNLEYIVYTMGSKGSIIITLEDYSVMEAPTVKVRDTVGAGDAFTATFITGLLQKKSLAEIHKKATEVAAVVCTQIGAITDLKY